MKKLNFKSIILVSNDVIPSWGNQWGEDADTETSTISENTLPLLPSKTRAQYHYKRASLWVSEMYIFLRPLYQIDTDFCREIVASCLCSVTDSSIWDLIAWRKLDLPKLGASESNRGFSKTGRRHWETWALEQSQREGKTVTAPGAIIIQRLWLIHDGVSLDVLFMQHWGSRMAPLCWTGGGVYQSTAQITLPPPLGKIESHVWVCVELRVVE